MAVADCQYVLGVNGGPHDGSAALLRDGELVSMIEQERLSRNRHAFGESPRDAIAACLDEAGIELRQLREIAIGWDVPKLAETEGVNFDHDEFERWLLGAPRREPRPPIRFVAHHLAHAASAFYTSGFDSAAILVLDGRGERVATTLAAGGPGGIEILRTWGTHLSLGHLYGWAAEWAGLTMWGTGKLMGLAAYGTPSQPSPLSCTEDGYEIVNAPPPGALPQDHFLQLRSRARSHFRALNYPFEQCAGGDVMAYAPFAASIQDGLEQVLLHLATVALRHTGLEKLVLAGGVGLNCSANGKLARAGIARDLWIPPFPHDAGVSVGAAFIADRLRHPVRRARRLRHARLAPRAPDVDLRRSPELAACVIRRLEGTRLAEEVAEYLERGLVVGWFEGRAEVGQRALGARSLLCDPRRRGALEHLNAVKGREVWRPLAPAVMAEHADRLFEGPLPSAADFMLVAWPVRAQARQLIPAAVHVDGSARPQLVRRADGDYYRLIDAFRVRTGVPAVINTSFNLAGEPIVYSPHDAVSAFVRSELDVLVVDGQVAVKRTSLDSKQRSPLAAPPRLSFTPWRGPPDHGIP
jgi:carbamoyltransferase